LSLVGATNTPRTVEIAGKPYRVSALTMAEWGEVQRWIGEQLVSPMDTLASRSIDQLSPFAVHWVTTTAVREQQNWPPRPGSEAWLAAVDRVGRDGRDGNTMLVYAVLRKHQPTLTIEDAEAISQASTVADGAVLLGVALGLDREKKAASPDPDPLPGP